MFKSAPSISIETTLTIITGCVFLMALFSKRDIPYEHNQHNSGSKLSSQLIYILSN